LLIHQAPSGHRDGRAAESALVAQSTFRRIEDEEGTEAALKAAIWDRAREDQRGFSNGFFSDFNRILMGF